MTFSELTRQTIGEAAFEAVRLYARTIGEPEIPPWNRAPLWMRAATLWGVSGALGGWSPRQLHDEWVARLLTEGWALGDKHDELAKTHPLLVPYTTLPPKHRAKNVLFFEVVAAFKRALEASR